MDLTLINQLYKTNHLKEVYKENPPKFCSKTIYSFYLIFLLNDEFTIALSKANLSIIFVYIFNKIFHCFLN